jgi:hypothetical protein
VACGPVEHIRSWCAGELCGQLGSRNWCAGSTPGRGGVGARCPLVSGLLRGAQQGVLSSPHLLWATSLQTAGWHKAGVAQALTHHATQQLLLHVVLRLAVGLDGEAAGKQPAPRVPWTWR